ncbi:hypothetical protein [Corynebacterium comes]|uniref:Uncharacterized protein n=1 Tax=Corynebacterium comes TaxID=2675218 RepID=A0A6B8VW25_9CORY|nr:hypothetical protein [Corynebacterium comes]QGU04311.1 hypothetical protein CETAM_05200 [Corynebacterium comes]
MDPYDAINVQLTHFVPSGHRGLVRRWMLAFLVSNPRLPIFVAAQAGCQLLSRWGTDVLQENRDESWTTTPLPATRTEWESDGYRVPDHAQPLVLTHLDGSQVELFLLFDVELVNEERVGTVDHTAVREPAEPHELAPTLSEFSLHLGERERAALSYLWRLGATLNWATGGDSGTPGWIEEAHHGRPCRPCPEVRGEDACYRIVIHPDVERTGVMPLVLELVAQLLGNWVQGRREGTPRRSIPLEQISDAEVAVVSHLVALRLGFGSRHLVGDLDVPDGIDWGRVVETAQVMEDLLQGLPNPLLPLAGTTEGTPTEPRLLLQDPFREVGRELNSRENRREREIAERWILDFVAGNGRFPLPTALALGWQLYHRWGTGVVGDPSRQDWVGTIELRSAAEWKVRGWVPRPDAVELVVPSGHGREVHYLLRDDVLIADRLAALESKAEAEPHNSALFRPGPDDAPALREFAELVPWRELQMLRNLWRNRILPCLPTSQAAPDGAGPTHLRLEVPHREDQSVTLSVIGLLATKFLTHEMDASPVCGLEGALVADIVARRLGVDYTPSPLVEEALSRGASIQFRWDVVYQAAATVENILSGFPD